MIMEDGTVDSVTCSSESPSGGTNGWGCHEDSDSASARHLVVMVHGILGSVTDWKFAADQFVLMLPDKVFVHCSERNEAKLTLDGVDVMGERLAEEVLEVIEHRPDLNKISFIAHSLGGLVARYAIGRLYRPPSKLNAMDSALASEETTRGTICGLEAMNFITVATPHLGSRGNKQVPFLFGVTAFEKAASRIVHWLFRRTGQHLFLIDDDEGKLPLLRRMVEDDEKIYFMSALRIFKRRVLYSNVGYDHIVGWRTSSVRRNSELPKLDDSPNEKYPHIVSEECCKAVEAEECPPVSVEGDGFDKLEGLWLLFEMKNKVSAFMRNKKSGFIGLTCQIRICSLTKRKPSFFTILMIVFRMFNVMLLVSYATLLLCHCFFIALLVAIGFVSLWINKKTSLLVLLNLAEELVTGLSKVSWEKVDVSFHSSMQRFAAHSVIQVKYHSMHSEGADVISHMIDHFLV